MGLSLFVSYSLLEKIHILIKKRVDLRKKYGNIYVVLGLLLLCHVVAELCKANVAQLVEQRTRNAQVSGPNPDVGSICKNSKFL